jgi:hypothetical protein
MIRKIQEWVVISLNGAFYSEVDWGGMKVLDERTALAGRTVQWVSRRELH